MKVLRAPAVVLLFFLAWGCDSGDPVELTSPEDVAGKYDFAAFSFEPDAQAIAPLNLLDTLDVSESALWLSGDGNFILQYRFQGGAPFFPAGEFEVSEQTVRLRGNDASASSLRKIMLDTDVVLRRTASDRLTFETTKNVNLEQFGARLYDGLVDTPGTLRLELRLPPGGA